MELTAKDVGLVPARMALGASMLWHGIPKIRAEGNAQAGQFFEQLGLKPGPRWAALAGVAEVFAGASLIFGIGTRLGALAVLATQGVAVAKVHGPKGFDNTAGGWEFNELIMATALGILIAGPGALSIHELVERQLQGGVRWLFEPRRRKGVGLAKLLK